jgi:filamentous hemagglutinin
LQLSARNSLDNSDGTLGASTLQVQGQALRNMRGTLQVQVRPARQVQQLDNSAGRMTFARGFELKAQSAINRGGSLAHGGSATTRTIGQLDNGEGSISSNATRLGLDIGTWSTRRATSTTPAAKGYCCERRYWRVYRAASLPQARQTCCWVVPTTAARSWSPASSS